MASYLIRKKDSEEEKAYYLNLASRPLKKSFSKYRGVQKNKSPERPYRVMLTYRGVRYNLGCYASEEKAALIYNAAALKIIGPHAVINKIEATDQ